MLVKYIMKDVPTGDDHDKYSGQILMMHRRNVAQLITIIYNSSRIISVNYRNANTLIKEGTFDQHPFEEYLQDVSSIIGPRSGNYIHAEYIHEGMKLLKEILFWLLNSIKNDDNLLNWFHKYLSSFK